MSLISQVSDGSIVKIEKKHLLAKCGFCKKTMMLVEGSIIVGNKWYHHNCFSHMDFTPDNRSTSKKERELQCDTQNNEVEKNGT